MSNVTISIFDLFSIGIGPSSSHTMGPMSSAFDFTQEIKDKFNDITRITITLYGSLAYTGVGHGTDKAVLMGLEGHLPHSIDPDIIPKRFTEIIKTKTIKLNNDKQIAFNISQDFIHDYEKLYDFHSNAMRFSAYHGDNIIATEIYYSIGGGFIIKDSHRDTVVKENSVTQPYPFTTAHELIQHCENSGLSLCEIMLRNEEVWHDRKTIKEKILHIAGVMEQCIEKGCQTEGVLEGRLAVKRRAPQLYQKLREYGPANISHPDASNWLNVYALAVNEENAAGSRVVTSPTNGAAGIVPAVLQYYKKFYHNASEAGVLRFLLSAGAIGILYKHNASISGAEMGCQGEVGVACSMAAAGLTAAVEGSIYQIENAAEIGMEHNLGLTCDPVDGLVQIPCIERNAMGAVKAVNASRLAMAGDGSHKVSLDTVIKTMYEIGKNMNSIYKETSKGGLAVNVPEC